MVFKTVEELGNRLPERGASFTLLPVTGKREKDVFKLLNLTPQQAGALPWQVRAVLAAVLDTVGEVKFPPPDDTVSTLKTRVNMVDDLKLGLGDAYYIYTCARIAAMGPLLKFTLGCPRCSAKNPYTLDLSKLRVEVSESGPLSKVIELNPPITISGKQYAKGTVTGVKFRVRDQMLDSFAEARVENVSLVFSLEGYEFPLAPELVDDWPLDLIKQIHRIANELTPGISEDLEFQCASCKDVNPYMVNWEYVSFFA